MAREPDEEQALRVEEEDPAKGSALKLSDLVDPSTSQYQAALRSKSLTVKLRWW